MFKNFVSIPEDILIEILSYLDGVSLVRSAMTCRTLRNVLRNSSRLTYILQLCYDGLSDAGTSKNHADLLTSLLERRRAWFALDWNIYSRFRMKGTFTAYELAAGCFASTERNTFSLLRLASRRNPNMVKFMRPIGIAYDFAMDPTQDLIVFLDSRASLPPQTNDRIFHLYISRVSKNDTPSSVRRSRSLRCVVERNRNVEDIEFQVERDRVWLFFCKAGEPCYPRVLMWNLTTCELLLDYTFSTHFSSLPKPLELSFALLDTCFCFVTHPGVFGSIWLYKLPQPGTSVSNLTLLAKLHLPMTSLGTTVTSISTHTSPSEKYPIPGMTFMPNDDDRLHAFTIKYRHCHIANAAGNPIVMPMNLFVHQRVLVKYCLQQQETLYNDIPLEVPWEEWGPKNTRILCPSFIDPEWNRYVHGQHVVCPGNPHPEFNNGSFSVEILDFSIAAVLTAMGVDITPSSHSSLTSSIGGVLMPPSIIFAKQIPFFRTDVLTYLPCVIVERKFGFPYTGYMIFEDGIAGIHILRDDNIHFDVYNV
ncbi:hypothetical protein BDN70DRAFT_94996 [Pholiota conissans]|uniref:F-box domain-containing protein n=1 Tax=Pholiota conissans TaxID=109636 RepID=A0A9P5YY80_9AGAR|nr:hypothetical protein BDN70DRAFT_94996 [Pholiota conissans]